MLIDNSKGNFRFIKGRNPFSSGAVADAGYEIVRAVFDPMLPLEAGFRSQIETHLRGIGRPLNALSGMELRIPQALSLEGFRHLPATCKGWRHGESMSGTESRGQDQCCPGDQSCAGGERLRLFVHGAVEPERSTFVISGAPEVGVSERNQRIVVAPGDVSREGMRQKIAQVLGSLHGLLQEIGASWGDATAVGVYTVQDIHPYMEDMLLREIPSANVHGITWHRASAGRGHRLRNGRSASVSGADSADVEYKEKH